MNVWKMVSKNGGTILTCMGVAGLVSTAITAGRASIKAVDLIAKERIARQFEYDEYVDDIEKSGDCKWASIEPLKKSEIFKLTWRCYIPTFLIGGASIACIIGANSVHLKKQAAIMSAYALAETGFKEYRHKVVEIIGDKKASEVRESIVQDRIKKNPPKHDTVIITGKGKQLCYEALSGRYFESDIEAIRKARNELNAEFVRTGELMLNDVYYALGLENNKIGYELGWYAMDPNIEQWLLEFKFDSCLTEDGVPCLVVDFLVPPTMKD